MSSKTGRLVPLAALGLIGVGLALVLMRTTSLHPGVAPNAPASSVAIARVDVNAVLGSSLWRHFVTDRGGDRGLVRLREQCGFDPAGQIDELMAFVTGEEARSLDHVVFAARGPFDHDALGECMSEVVESQGGGLRRTEVEGLPAIAGARGDSRIAFLGAEGAVFGAEPAVVEVIRTVRGETAALDDDELLQLWDSVGTHRDIGLAARVPSHWREVIEERVDPMARDLVSTFIGDLRAFGLGARVRRGLAFGLALRYGDPERAKAAEQLLVDRRDGLLESVLVSLSPAGPALRRLAVEARGRELVVAIDLSQERVDRLLELVERLRADPEQLDRILGGEAPRPRPEPRPDAVLNAPAPPSESEAPSETPPPPLPPRP